MAWSRDFVWEVMVAISASTSATVDAKATETSEARTMKPDWNFIINAMGLRLSDEKIQGENLRNNFPSFYKIRDRMTM